MPTVEIANTHLQKKIPMSRVKALASAVLTGEKKSTASWISIVFMSDRRIRTINRRHLGHDYITDCISFPLHENGSNVVEGEIYISLDRAYAQAREHGVTYFNEILRLVAHGSLHLCGYDDKTRKQRLQMMDLGEKYLPKQR